MRERSRVVLAATLLLAAGCGTKKSGDTADRAILVSPISGSTTEAGGQATFTVALSAKPSGDVTVGVASGDVNEGTVSPATLTFTKLDFNAPQTVTVTGENDDVADGSKTYDVTLSPASTSDAKYAAIAVAPVHVVNVDDETAAIVVSPISGPTSENGGQATFSVVLTSQPTSDVTVNYHSSSLTEATVSPASLTFTAANYLAPQTVTVTGVNDDIADGNAALTVTFDTTTGNDGTYAALKPANVPVTNIDDDTAQILVSAIDRPTTEAGGTAHFTVKLTSQPTADVTVNFDTDAAAEGTPDVTSLTFNAMDFAVPKLVTLTGQNDAIADGNQPFHVAFAATTSNDPKYAAITPASVGITNVDDDTAGYLVSAASGPTTESGGYATFSIGLTSQPTDDVAVTLASSNGGEGLLSDTQLTFTAADYAPKTVTVFGQDDLRLDGNQPYAATFAVASNDPAYAAIVPQNVALANVDDDVPQNVLVIHATFDPSFEGDVKAKLDATQAFQRVDAFDAATVTPTLSQLADYDAALVFTDGTSFSDPTALGDVLADFFDSGKRVVLATFAEEAGLQVGGRYGAQYLMTDPSANQTQPPADLGTVSDPASPLVRGVNALHADAAYASPSAPTNGGAAVLSWSDGRPLVILGTFGTRRLVDLNMFPPSNDAGGGAYGLWNGDGGNLIRNTLLFDRADAANGGLETASFASWATSTTCGNPLTPWSIDNAGFFGDGVPASGAHFAMNGMDGDGPCDYTMTQTVPVRRGQTVLTWQDRIRWDMANIAQNSTLPRQFEVLVNGNVVYSESLQPLTAGDTGYVAHSVDITSLVSGGLATVEFHDTVPESFTGPAQLQIDSVSVSAP